MVEIRLQTWTREEAEDVKRQLEQLHGDAIRLGNPRLGRGRNVWFVYGELRLSAQPQRLQEQEQNQGE